jgi:dsDNA-specific endonuclease/ATPase MutS2
MAKIKDLWVGDFVILSASKRIGKFVSVSGDGRGRFEVGDKIVLVAEGSFVLKPEEDNFPNHLLNDFLEDKAQTATRKAVKVKFDHTIDLHIDKLAPELTNDFPGRIIEYQLSKCKQFIEEAIRLRYPHITIIHGKGQGVLKKEVEALLGSYPESRFQVSKNDGGALEVWLG